MCKKTILLIPLLLSLMIATGAGCPEQDTDSQEPKTEPIPETEEKEKINFTIDFGNNKTKSFDLYFSEEKTVYALLLELADQNKITLEIKEYDFGVLVEAIDGIKNGEQNKYWLYYFNSEMAPVGIFEQKVSPGNKIEFKFEESSF